MSGITSSTITSVVAVVVLMDVVLSLAVAVPKISDTDKALVRENLMEAIVQAPSIVR